MISIHKEQNLPPPLANQTKPTQPNPKSSEKNHHNCFYLTLAPDKNQKESQQGTKGPTDTKTEFLQ